MREINLAKFKIRTDLITDIISSKKINGVTETITKFENIKISNVIVSDDGGKSIGKKNGNYVTVFFDDVTDNTNRCNLLKVFKDELKNILDKESINLRSEGLIIGLGNIKSTPDALGPKIIEKIKVTRHIKLLVGNLENGYSVVSSFTPGVMGNTGIETKDLIASVINKVKPDYVIAIDSLASNAVDRVNKTIQITNTGIHPGSGVGNAREELSKETLGIPVIAIGVPTVVDATSIVYDTINYMIKHFSYNIKNINNRKLKFVPAFNRNYLNYTGDLNFNERKEFLGLLGTLNDEEIRQLIYEVLTPIGYNLMVTPKEIDFVIEKLVDVISNGINHSIHDYI